MVFETIKAVVEGKPYILIEKVAGVICQELLINFQGGEDSLGHLQGKSAHCWTL